MWYISSYPTIAQKPSNASTTCAVGETLCVPAARGICLPDGGQEDDLSLDGPPA